MKVKQVIGFIIAVVGAVSVGYGFYAKREVSAARVEIHKIANSDNPVVKSVGKELESVIGGYRNVINWCFIGGGALIVIGVGFLICCRKCR